MNFGDEISVRETTPSFDFRGRGLAAAFGPSAKFLAHAKKGLVIG
jgi:hypothetical protein